MTTGKVAERDAKLAQEFVEQCKKSGPYGKRQDQLEWLELPVDSLMRHTLHLLATARRETTRKTWEKAAHVVNTEIPVSNEYKIVLPFVRAIVSYFKKQAALESAAKRER